MKNYKTNILLAEDDPNLGIVLKEYLELKKYTIQLVQNGVEGLQVFKDHQFDLCLLDVMMPLKDGFTLANEIKSIDKDVPIIFLTAKSLNEDKIKGFTLGADDYLTKPFSMEELLLRIQAVMRRSESTSSPTTGQTEFEFGEYFFNSKTQKLSKPGYEKKLTSKEAELLKLLLINKNNTLTREIALNTIWGNDDYFTARSMDVFITKLRKIFKDDSNIEIISVHGKGFKIVSN